jgi:hypothetical protein
MQPKIIFKNEKSALIECSYVPSYSASQLEEAARVENAICRKSCGIWRDAQVLDQDLKLKSHGQENFRLLCLNPSSPYLPELTKKVRETGSLSI